MKAAHEKYKMSATAYLESIGFWGRRTLAAHAVSVWPQTSKSSRADTSENSHNPKSNMKLASGTSPVTSLRAAGVTVGLRTDGAASNNDLDMFEAMRQAAFLHKLVTRDPRAMSAPTALRMATIDGATALGMDKTIGSLEPGKRADMIIVSMASARQTPMYDPLSHLVYVTRVMASRSTMVNGKILMRDRKMLTLDENAVLAEARSWSDECARR